MMTHPSLPFIFFHIRPSTLPALKHNAVNTPKIDGQVNEPPFLITLISFSLLDLLKTRHGVLGVLTLFGIFGREKISGKNEVISSFGKQVRLLVIEFNYFYHISFNFKKEKRAFTFNARARSTTTGTPAHIHMHMYIQKTALKFEKCTTQICSRLLVLSLSAGIKKTIIFVIRSCDGTTYTLLYLYI